MQMSFDNYPINTYNEQKMNLQQLEISESNFLDYLCKFKEVSLE